jgi:acetyl-CoA synthetase
MMSQRISIEDASRLKITVSDEDINNISKVNLLREYALSNIERFWEEQALLLHWFRRWDKVVEWNPPYARWFINGLTNASYNALDRHVKNGKGDKKAIVWEGEDGEKRTLTYNDVYTKVNMLASALKEYLGLKRGDRVTIYMPMVPELIIAMLACSRIGVIHSVVFSGFSTNALADRIDDSSSSIVITADGFYRRGKVIDLISNVNGALAYGCKSVKHVIVFNRLRDGVTNGITDPINKVNYHTWDDILKEGSSNYDAEMVGSNEPLFMLYTSGTTGKPKGILHSTGGYLTYANSTFRWVFGITDNDIYFCTADIGWVTGHTYVVYAPMLNATTVVIYEGAPDYPSIYRWFEIIERYRVSIFYTTPTALRMLMRNAEDYSKRHDLSSLRLLGSVGEPINPQVWLWYYKSIGGERCPIVDTWWQTETGACMISNPTGIARLPMKPGSATLPLPGVEAAVVDERGNEVKPYTKGYLVIKRPWPGLMLTIWNDDARYREIYWSRFKGVYYTGDYAMQDDDGYFWLLGRADDVLKVSGHRIGSMELESAIVAHDAVAEAAVVGKIDEVKGESIVAFVVLKQGYQGSYSIKDDIIRYVKNKLGAIAVIDEVYFVNKLPKTRSGKIMRRLLKSIVNNTGIGDVTTLEDEAAVDEVKAAYEELKRQVNSN